MSHLADFDAEIYKLCLEEKQRQLRGIELIASENFPSANVLEALASSFHNKYSEGYPNARYYHGTEVVDKLELLCQERALKCFKLDPSIWGVNVQALSGSPANFAVFTALAGPHGRIMGLDLPDGGHLTHGFQTSSGKKVSATSLFFESMPYKLDPETHLIDFAALGKNAKLFQPKIIIAGTSVYSRFLDYSSFRKVCDEVGAYLLSDMAHIAGLVAAGLHPSPFEFSDVVTTTTHKTLRGPRNALIFYRKIKFGSATETTNFEKMINEAVFPGLNGGPHNHAIAATAVALKEASQPEYIEYQRQVVKNMQALATKLMENNLKVITNGTDVHQCLVDLKPCGLNGSKVSAILERIGIIVNKNTVPGDKSAINPSGIRIGTPAMTSRQMKEPEMIKIGNYILEAIKIAQQTVVKMEGKTLVEFVKIIDKDERIPLLKKKIENWAQTYPLPGLNY
ncbi:Serine hydroxymethyltransferase, cytosolic [Cichlidogyrus casuarinus]|uniref:glycine hydroxymethyltransferase n=1 Tax=Cichlidogyrus casuarinus TaxID=1844966 RepID=A0ABD2QGX3_9PLAT